SPSREAAPTSVRRHARESAGSPHADSRPRAYCRGRTIPRPSSLPCPCIAPREVGAQIVLQASGFAERLEDETSIRGMHCTANRGPRIRAALPRLAASNGVQRMPRRGVEPDASGILEPQVLPDDVPAHRVKVAM